MSKSAEAYMSLAAQISGAESKRRNKPIELEVHNTEREIISGNDIAGGHKSTPKKRRSMGRTHQIHTRLSDKELAQFTRRVEKSGLPQGEYIRRAVLNNEVVIDEHSAVDIAILDALSVIQAEIGRQGGMLKMLIKPNEGQRELAPEEWRTLIAAIKDLESAKNMVADIKCMIENGNH